MAKQACVRVRIYGINGAGSIGGLGPKGNEPRSRAESWAWVTRPTVMLISCVVCTRSVHAMPGPQSWSCSCLSTDHEEGHFLHQVDDYLHYHTTTLPHYHTTTIPTRPGVVAPVSISDSFLFFLSSSSLLWSLTCLHRRK